MDKALSAPTDRPASLKSFVAMEISISTFSTFRLVAVAGMLDAKSAEGLDAVLPQTADSANRHLIIDLSGVGIATQAGLAGLLVVAQRAAARGGRFRICGAEQGLEKRIHALGHPQALPCDPTMAASITAMSQATDPDGSTAPGRHDNRIGQATFSSGTEGAHPAPGDY